MQAFSNSDKESASTTLMTPSVLTSKLQIQTMAFEVTPTKQRTKTTPQRKFLLISAESENSEDCGHGSRVCSTPGGGTTSMLPFVCLLIQPKLCFDTLTMKSCMKMQ